MDYSDAEQLTYESTALHTEPTNLLNSIAAQSNRSTNLEQGIPIPLQKPDKLKAPAANFRSIIQLALVRKLLDTSYQKNSRQNQY